MSELLASIAKFLSVSWRAGAAVAIAAGLVWFLKSNDIQPVRDFPQDLYQYVILAGLLGFSVVAVQVGVLLCQGLASVARSSWRSIIRLAEGRVRRNEALENLKCVSQQELYCLLWLKALSRQRFKAYPYPILEKIHEAGLIERQTGYGQGTHWRVPDYIWSALDKTQLPPGSVPILRSGHPPWETMGNHLP